MVNFLSQIGNIEQGLVKGKEAVAMDTTDGLSWSILGKNLHRTEFKSQEISIATLRNITQHLPPSRPPYFLISPYLQRCCTDKGKDNQ